MIPPAQKPPRRYHAPAIIGAVLYALLMLWAAAQGSWDMFILLLGAALLSVGLQLWGKRPRTPEKRAWHNNDE
jgi:predicted phage tail protein